MATRRFLLLLLLSGCTMGPDFTSPENFAPDSWFRATPLAAEPSKPVEASMDAHWWVVLHDTELNALIEKLSTQNLDVLTATERVEESRAQLGIVASDLYPKINGDASYTREKLSDKGVISLVSGGGAAGASGGAGGAGGAGGIPSMSKTPPFNIYQYGFDASWEIDLWGKVRRGVEAAGATVQANEDARRGTEISAIAELVNDYVQLRGTQAQLAIAQDNLKAAHDIAALTENRANSGLSSKLDVTSAKAQEDSFQAQIPPLEQQRDQLMNAMALLLGQAPGALESELLPAQPMPSLPASVPIGIPSELAERRPDIRQAEDRLHAATAQIGVAKANFFPSITLSGNGMLQALEFKDLNTWAARAYTFGPDIQLPIFEGGQLVSTLELRNAEQREAAIQYRKTLLTALHEVDNALTAFQNEQQRSQSLDGAVEENREAVALATDRYKKGLATYLDVLNAEQNLLNAQLQATGSRQTGLTDMVQLYKALGGGWNT